MITLYGFGPALGLPVLSPFVTKAHILLKMAGLQYQTNVSAKGLLGAPKGKLPYIKDGDAVIADSTFIRFYIEKSYGFDFDKGLGPAEKALGWALERMCEERLYWLMVDARWLIDANFAAGPERIFDGLPWPACPLVKAYGAPGSCVGPCGFRASDGTTPPPSSNSRVAIWPRFPTRLATSHSCSATSPGARMRPSARS